MHWFVRIVLAGLALIAFVAAPVSARAELKIVVTIAPVHSLVSVITDGVVEPELLMPGGTSPHAFSLKPSQAKMLREANVIVRVSDNLETFLERPLAALGAESRIVTLDRVAGMKLLEMRSSGVWEAHADHSEGEPGDQGDVKQVERNHAHHDHAHHDHMGSERSDDGRAYNPHIWLDPQNAIVAVIHIATLLGKADPKNAKTYWENAKTVTEQLSQLDRELASATSSIRRKPYVVFHDAYAYFEARYQLSPAGAVTISPEHVPGAKRLVEIRRRVAVAEAKCVFSEPQFEPRLVATIIEGSNARGAVLDPLGAALEPGPGLYASLMRNLAQTMLGCLGRS